MIVGVALPKRRDTVCRKHVLHVKTRADAPLSTPVLAELCCVGLGSNIGV